MVSQFYEEFGYLLEHDIRLVYTIKESVILSLYSDFMTKTDIIKAMIIKDYSYAPKRVRYDESRRYYEFARYYLQKQKTNR